MGLTRALLAGAALSLAATAGSSPAVADAGTGRVTFLACEPGKIGHCVRGELTARVYPTLLGVVVVDFTCVVAAYPDAVSTQVDGCTFNGVTALPMPASSPTPVVARQGTAIVPTGGSYLGCISGAGHFLEPVLGPVTVSGAACETTEVVPTQ